MGFIPLGCHSWVLACRPQPGPDLRPWALHHDRNSLGSLVSCITPGFLLYIERLRPLGAVGHWHAHYALQMIFGDPPGTIKRDVTRKMTVAK